MSLPEHRAGAALQAPALPLAALGLVLAPAAVEGLFFQPKAETVLTRTTVWSADMATVETEVLENGEPTRTIPAVRSEVTSELSVTTIDRHVRAASNLPLELVRTFDDVTLELEGGLALGEAGGRLALSGDGESELDQIAVHFEYDPDRETYARRYAEDYQGREELLEPLRAEAEFIGLLPGDPGAIEVGDRWEVDLDRLTDILVPGGYVPLVTESSMDAVEGALDPLLLPGPFDLLTGEASGDFTAELESVQDGVATIALRLDLELRSDQAEAVGALLDGAVPEGALADLRRADHVLRLEGKGTLRWDLAAYHARSFSVTCDAEVDVEIAVDVNVGGEELLFELTESRAGEIRVESSLEG